MPAATNISYQPCRRCNKPSEVVIRSETLCLECFNFFLTGKVTKHMITSMRNEGYSHDPKPYLLPLSFGQSSLSLLHMLSQWQNSKKQKPGRSSYRLHVVHVQETLNEKENTFENLKILFPEHEYSTTTLSSLFTGNSEVEKNNNLLRLMDSLTSATAKVDVARILLTRSLVEFAKVNNLQGILWGDTTTRMAERVLAETAKGRGFSLPWQVNDGETPYEVNFYYPLRDVFKKELAEYVRFTPVKTLIRCKDFLQNSTPVNLKNTSIDALMSRYFESAEDQYPNIVTNVVRTSTKLKAGNSTLKKCKLCVLPLTDEDNTDTNVCYGCMRNVSQEGLGLLPWS